MKNGFVLKKLYVKGYRGHIYVDDGQLTGDFYTVGQILGHSLKGVGMQLDISSSLDSVTAQYVDVRLDGKKTVLDAYHNAVHPNEKRQAITKKPHKNKHEMER